MENIKVRNRYEYMFIISKNYVLLKLKKDSLNRLHINIL